MEKFTFNNLEREYLHFKPEIDLAVQHVMASGQYLFGVEVEKLESNFKQLTGKKYAIAVKNATDAITLTLLAMERYPMSMKCYLPCFGAYPTAVAVVNASQSLNFIDVDDTLTMDVSKLPHSSGKLSDPHLYHTVIAVDTFGNTSNKVPDVPGRFIIQDCAQSTCNKDYSWAHVNIFSFYPTKPLASMGDGGMICLNDEAMYNRIKCMRFYGIENNKVQGYGINSRMDEIQAAIVNVKFDKLQWMNAQRRRIAERYMGVIPHSLLKTIKENTCVYHQFPIIALDRSLVCEKLNQAGIPYMIHYPQYVSDMSYFVATDYSSKNKNINNQIISLPCNTWMEEEEIKKVEQFLKKLR